MKITQILLFFFLLVFQQIPAQSQDDNEKDPVNITAMAVIQKYISAIGGLEKFKSVEERTTTMTGFAMNQKIDIVIKQKYPDNLNQELTVGEVNQTIYYKDGRGVIKIGDETTEIQGNELERLKVDATMQFLIDPESYGVTAELLPNEYIDSVECLL